MLVTKVVHSHRRRLVSVEGVPGMEASLGLEKLKDGIRRSGLAPGIVLLYVGGHRVGKYPWTSIVICVG